MAEWQTLSTRVAYENPFMRVHEDQVINPVGKQTLYGYVESTEGSAYIVPIDKDGNTYLIRQYRYPIKQATWECIAGRVDEKNMEAEARRELLEETGMTAGDITPLGEMYMATGITAFRSTVYIARQLTKVADKLDEEDGILNLKKLPLKEAIQQVMSGDIQCSPSISALFMAKTYLEGEKP